MLLVGPASVGKTALVRKIGTMLLNRELFFLIGSEYPTRLGLIETSSAGRTLTREGRRYLNANPPPDLRQRISRAM